MTEESKVGEIRKFFKELPNKFTLSNSGERKKQTSSGNHDKLEETPHGMTGFLQTSPSSSRNNVRSEDRTPQRTENSPEPPQTTAETDDKLQEATPQRTKSNKVQPQPAATSEFSYGKSLSFDDKVEQIRRAIKRKPSMPVKVGIFSRSSESEYQWLKTKLESASCVSSVRSCYISNSGFQDFLDNVSSCDFGILYHTQNRGRLNLTDVKDSLYDEELQELSSRLGKKNVIVVIDDLKDSGEERKKEILEGQPSLGSLAVDVFLFSEDEKKKNKETSTRKGEPRD